MLQTTTLWPGQPVFSADQRRIGSLAEVRGPFVRVRRLFRKDLWLASNFVLWADDRRVVMSFGIRDLARYGRRQVPRAPEPSDDAGGETLSARFDADEPAVRPAPRLAADTSVLEEAAADMPETAASMHGTLLLDYARHLRAELATIERELDAHQDTSPTPLRSPAQFAAGS